MNQCDDKHEPKFRITYKPALGQKYHPVWFVCENCYEKRPFGSDEFIHSIEPLSKVVA